jgi:hypothetical protein
MNKVTAAAIVASSCVLGSGLIAFGLYMLLLNGSTTLGPLHLVVLALPGVGFLIGLIAAMRILK